MTERFGRYLDVDGDGIPYRTYPGAHPQRALTSPGSSRDEYAAYTEDGDVYVRNMDRLLKKFEPPSHWSRGENQAAASSPKMPAFFGTPPPRLRGARDAGERRHSSRHLRLRSFPFTQEVEDFIEEHDRILY
ncbi:MAG: hypothetical protein CM15mP125_3450 [Gammaproteobacteria bacterium]|nr:MAG: hypothetical protein CM15mP125_3450 [Gammaproteobacteria bacterium]